MKKIIISIFGLSLIGLTNASEKNGDLKSSATIQATCLISANQIGFGAIATPLLAQSAQSEMNVKCSNASAYTIDLAYGGIYGQGSSDSYSGYTIEAHQTTINTNQYSIYNSSGVNQGVIYCGYAGGYGGQVYFGTTQGTANLFGYNNTGIWQQDTKGACTSNNTQNGTYPTGWTGAYNTSGRQPLGGTAYTYGVMNGLSKGDKLAYSIQVPSDSTKVWNKGNNSYNATGNGDFQIIPVVAKIVPDKSGSKYPAPDMYLDTVTAVISY